MANRKSNDPPRWIQKWLDKYCKAHLAEGILGDLEELFIEDFRNQEAGKQRECTFSDPWDFLGQPF